MASEVPVKAVNTQLVQGSRPPPAATGNKANGKNLPPANPSLTATAAAVNNTTEAKAPAKPQDAAAAKPSADVHTLVAQLNRRLQSSGRPNQYKIDTSAGRSVIQEINPDTGQVLSELPASEFKELAQDLGVSGLLVDTRA